MADHEFICIRARHNNSSHVSAICNIDQRCAGPSMSLSEVNAILARSRHRGFIAMTPFDETRSAPIGFVIYEVMPEAIEIRHLSVIPEFRKRGVGRGLFELVLGELDGQRQEVVANVPLANLPALAFLRQLNKSYDDGNCGKFRLLRGQDPDVIQFSLAPCLIGAHD